MRDGEYAYVVPSHQVGDVIRETGYRRSPNVQIRRDPGDRRARPWPIGEPGDRRLDRIDERRAETWTLVVVPGRCCVEFGSGFRRESNGQTH